MKTWIRNARFVYDFKHHRFENHKSILVETDKPSILTHPTFKPDSKTRVIDGENAVVLPGMTNGHTHVAMNFLRTLEWKYRKNIVHELMFPTEKNLRPDLVYALARLGIAECLLTGSTQIVDHYYFADEVAKACVSLGMRGLICDCAQDLRGPWPTEKDFQRHLQFVDDWTDRHPLIQPLVGPHATDTLSREKGVILRDFSQGRGLRNHFHLAQTQQEVDFCTAQYGKSPVQYAFEEGWLNERTIAAHCIYVDEDDIQTLAQSKAKIAFCPSSQVTFAKLPPLDGFIKHNVQMILGTDAYGASDSMSLLNEISVAQVLLKEKLTNLPNIPILPFHWTLWDPRTTNQDVVVLDGSRVLPFLTDEMTPEISLPSIFGQMPVRYSLINGAWCVEDGQLAGHSLDAIRREGNAARQELLSAVQ